MPKRTKKLLVYLDQNFISEIAKRDPNSKVRPEFTDLYEILKKGFSEEKLVDPQSHFHEVETSLAPILKKQIVKYQNYVGQVGMHSHYHVEELMAGENPLWVAKQMGHTDAALTLKRYGRWIASDMPDAGNKAIALWSQLGHHQAVSDFK